jgi:hypothetical protein
MTRFPDEEEIAAPPDAQPRDAEHEVLEGTLQERVAKRKKLIEEELRKQPEDLDEKELEEEADLRAQHIEAKDWLVAHWGETYACPVCRNVKWTVSSMVPAYNGFFSFYVTCRHCGNSMSVIPGHADLPEPVVPPDQLQFPEGEP